jgi:ribonuclease P protein component
MQDARMPRPLGFPKSRRLTRTSEFQRVRETGGVTRGELLSLGVLLAGDGGKMRAGFVTSRRVGGAVVRNRVRRRLREIVRRHQHRILQGVWIVTMARPRAARATSDALEHEWLRLAKRASILAP